MSALVSMKREREKLAFADRLAAIERMLKRGSVGEPEKLLAKLLTAEEVAGLLRLKLGTIRNMKPGASFRACIWASARCATGWPTCWR